MFCGDRKKKTKYEARTKIESETSTLAPGDVLNKNLNLQNVDIGTFTKRLSIMRNWRAKISPPNPSRINELIASQVISESTMAIAHAKKLRVDISQVCALIFSRHLHFQFINLCSSNQCFELLSKRTSHYGFLEINLLKPSLKTKQNIFNDN